MKQHLTFLPLALVLTVILGCGPKLPPGMPKLYPVTVTVTFDDGKPVVGASVKFRLTDPVLARTWLHAGTTDSQGKVKMVTDGEYPGIPVGKYTVTIESFETDWAAGRSGGVVPRYQLVEDDYLDHAKTPLKDIEVKAKMKELTLSAGEEQRIYNPIRQGI